MAKNELFFERDAMAGNDMPDGLTGPEQMMFLSLRSLYYNLRKGIIRRDEAIREKRKLVEEYRLYSFHYRMWESGAKRFKSCELASSAVRKDPELSRNPLVVSLLEAIYGPVKSKGESHGEGTV